MVNCWALHSGKVDQIDLIKEDTIGQSLSLESFKNTAVREFQEELNYQLTNNQLQLINQFYMTKKDRKLYFTLFALELTTLEVSHLHPDLTEIGNIQLFSLSEFKNLQNLGDAIQYKKDIIIQYLDQNW
ncbi:MAG: NUDIX hydrolase [Spirochaetes bacterium]|nr:NUDIX hydrolase [Spirochaetota bacterium]